MNSKSIGEFVSSKAAALKRLTSLVLMGVLLATLIPAFVASAADWDVTADGDYNLLTVPSTFTSYFYRVGVEDSDTDFSYGYGYGYTGGSASYGYGYGYGYGQFKVLGQASTLTAGNFYQGFFTSGGTLSSSSTLPGASSGALTLAYPVTLGSSTIAGVKVLIPATTVTDSGGAWAGVLSAASGTTVPSAVTASFSSANVVTMTATGATGTLTFGDEVVIKIPHSTFSGFTTQLVNIVSDSGSVYGVSACNSSQFTGDSTVTADLENSAKYSLTDATSNILGSHCYVFYNPTGTASDAVYVATRHFSSFVAGESAAAASSSSSSSGGGGGGSSSGSTSTAKTVAESKKSPVEKVVLVEDTKTTNFFDAEGKGLAVTNFADAVSLDKTDWKYKTIERIAPTGLFQGENVNGKRMFNMTDGMNRAMSAMVVARYAGCDVETMPAADPFSDVKKDAWYAPAIGCLKGLGVVNGKTPTVYAPGDLVTRAEFFKLMTEAYLVLNPSLESAWRTSMGSSPAVFADVSSSDWFAGYVNFAYAKGLLTGYAEGGKRYAKGNATVMRIEAAKMVVNYLDL